MDYLGPYLLGPNDENQGIYTGDARELARAISDESVDMIFTDPVYQNIDDYRWLAETAARVLKPDSACLTFHGIGYMDKSVSVLGHNGLNYRWQMPTYQPTISRRADCFFGLWYPLVLHERGRVKFRFTPQDLRVSLRRQSLPADHTYRWTKDPDVIAYYLEAFCGDDTVAFDPFTGGGTVPAVCKMLGRKWLAFEIDPDTAERARERVRNTQPPLFVMEPEQMEMGL